MEERPELDELMGRFRTTATLLRRRNGTEGHAGDDETIFGRWRRWSRRTYHALQQYGHQVTALAGLSRARQAYELLQIQRQWGFETKHYYWFRLFNKKAWREASLYVSESQMNPYRRFFRACINQSIQDVLDNKHLFIDHCNQHGISVINTIAIFRQGFIEWCQSNEDLPSRDIFVKPMDAFGGQGAMRWRYVDGFYYSDDNVASSKKRVVEIIKEESYRCSYLLQPKVQNHPILYDLVGSDTLACVRVVTSKSLGTEIDVKASMLAIPGAESPVANFSKGNRSLGVAVDVNTGKLGKAFSKKHPLFGPFGEHPITHQKIEGFQIPFWSDVKALACRAHTTLPELPMVGWDIAITPGGPMLIEGNIGFGIESLQIVHQTPLAKMGIPQRALSFVEENI